MPGVLTTSSLRIWSITSPWMLAAGGLYCTRISTLRSFSALPAFMIQGTPAHLCANLSLSHEALFHPKADDSRLALAKRLACLSSGHTLLPAMPEQMHPMKHA